VSVNMRRPNIKNETLELPVEIPAHEKWLFDNKTSLQQVTQGIQDAAAGRVVERDFSECLDDDGK